MPNADRDQQVDQLASRVQRALRTELERIIADSGIPDPKPTPPEDPITALATAVAVGVVDHLQRARVVDGVLTWEES